LTNGPITSLAKRQIKLYITICFLSIIKSFFLHKFFIKQSTSISIEEKWFIVNMKIEPSICRRDSIINAYK